VVSIAPPLTVNLPPTNIPPTVVMLVDVESCNAPTDKLFYKVVDTPLTNNGAKTVTSLEPEPEISKLGIL